MKRAPVFFIGMPRSGTTILFEVFSRHPEFTWFSNYTNKLWMSPYNNVMHRFFKNLGEKEQGQATSFFNKLLPKPIEGYPIWVKLLGKKFPKSTCEDLSFDSDQIHAVRTYISNLMWASHKKGFMAKFTGPSRAVFLSEIFPEAAFVEIIRNPKGVVSSLMNIDFWKNNSEKGYWKGVLSEDNKQQIRESNFPEIASTAIQWRNIVESTRHELATIQNRHISIRYEDLVENPQIEVQKISDFINIDLSATVQDYLRAREFRNMNYKADKFFSVEELMLIESLCREEMIGNGYKLVKSN
jgi:hypothetical protein